MTESDAAWLAAFLKENWLEIMRECPAQYGGIHCFEIAQLAAKKANGRLRYQEGQARAKGEQKWEYHAWNTFDGMVVDLSIHTNMPDDPTFTDILIVPAAEVYEEYKPNQSYTGEQVQTKIKERGGKLDWFVVPPHADPSGF